MKDRGRDFSSRAESAAWRLYQGSSHAPRAQAIDSPRAQAIELPRAYRPETVRPGVPLPSALAFLPSQGVPLGLLLRAMELAEREGVRPEQAMLAHGLMRETDYFRALARHLGLDFIADARNGPPGPSQTAPRVMPCANWPDAIKGGVVLLASDPETGDSPHWLLAPSGARLDDLLALYRTGRLPRERFVIAPPAVLREKLFAQNASAIADHAACALPRRDPALSAFGMRPGRPSAVSIMAALVLAGLCAAFARAGILWLSLSLAAGLILSSSIVVRLFAAAASCGEEPETAPPLADADLPVYTVVAALYREARVAQQLVAALGAFDYPASRLDIKIVVEEGDSETIAALRAISLPARFELIIAPDGQPRTKPRALNMALALARGSLICIFDAEDIPQPRQLRDVAEYFAAAPPEVACVQARLVIDNGDGGWLSSAFALEYAALFDVINPGLARLGMPIPLGGTSNHFRTQALQDAGGWDAWNVTEDIDLGLRLARSGFRTQVIASGTGEEAPVSLAVWMRQRRRWFKGWMQTLIVHARAPRSTLRDMGGLRMIVAASHVGGALLGAMLGPLFVGIALYDAVNSDILTPATWLALLVSTCWCSIFVAGTLAAFWPLCLAVRRRRLSAIAPLILLMPAYWLLQTIAAWWALVDLIRNPYHWHKTSHGLTRRARGPIYGG